jgi:hypothetical protein
MTFIKEIEKSTVKFIWMDKWMSSWLGRGEFGSMYGKMDR